jgi:hypothetical protein
MVTILAAQMVTILLSYIIQDLGSTVLLLFSAGNPLAFKCTK